MKISVIVPVYHVENYIRDCVDSLRQQSFDDYEILLVDDGSPDNCPSICDSYADADQRITVIHQANSGISCARNAGLEIAKGDYIAFVDSDDIVDQAYLKCLYECIVENHADMVIAQHISFNGTNLPALPVTSRKTEIISGREACLHRYSGDNTFLPAVWGKLLRKEIIGNLRFPVGKIHEDQYFVSLAMYRSAKIAVLDLPLYYYRLRESSITGSAFSLGRFDNIILMDEVITYYRATGDTEVMSAAKWHRQKTLAQYTLQAKAAGLTPPSGCHMSLIRAIATVRNVYGEDKCEWYLSQIYPWITPWYERLEWLLRHIRKIWKG